MLSSKQLYDKYILVNLVAILLAFFFAAVYVAFSPSLGYQHFDSFSYGYYAETQGLKMIRGNHPLGHIILNTAFVLVKLLGYSGRALPFFQIANSIISGITIGLFFVLSVAVFRFTLLNAFGLSTILGSSFAFWHYAGTADIYNVSSLFLILAWSSLVYETRISRRRTLIMSGMLVGLSILAHQLNSIVVLAGLVLALDDYHLVKMRFATFLGFIAITLATGYLFFGYIALSSLSPLTILQWVKGYVGAPAYGRYLSIETVPVVLSTALQAFIHIGWSVQSQVARSMLIVLVLLPILVYIIQNKKLAEGRQRIIAASLLQCFVSWILIFWWEPENLKFWLLPIVPFTITLGYCSEIIQARIPRILSLWPNSIMKLGKFIFISYLPLLGITLFLFNFKFGLVNEHKPDPIFQEAMNLWLEHSNPNDLIITDNRLTPALRYWSNRPNTLNLHESFQASLDSSDHFDHLRETINDALNSNKSVWFTPAAIDFYPPTFLSVDGISHEKLYIFFDTFKQQKMFLYPNTSDGTRGPVYRLSYK